jgi:hypothetical protein
MVSCIRFSISPRFSAVNSAAFDMPNARVLTDVTGDFNQVVNFPAQPGLAINLLRTTSMVCEHTNSEGRLVRLVSAACEARFCNSEIES